MRPKHLLAAAALSVAATAALAQAADPYLWLEEIEGAKPLAQVKQWNAATEATLGQPVSKRAASGRCSCSTTPTRSPCPAR